MNRQMLKLVEMKNDDDRRSDTIGLEATVLGLDERTFARLASSGMHRMMDAAAWCGTPGCSGFDDQWGRRLSCPGFGQA